jgi:hypothetical protein
LKKPSIPNVLIAANGQSHIQPVRIVERQYEILYRDAGSGVHMIDALRYVGAFALAIFCYVILPYLVTKDV